LRPERKGEKKAEAFFEKKKIMEKKPPPKAGAAETSEPICRPSEQETKTSASFNPGRPENHWPYF
jgi:hypothetical protein